MPSLRVPDRVKGRVPEKLKGRVPDSVKNKMSAQGNLVRDRMGAATSKLRKIDPKAAGGSAARSATGAKDIVRMTVAYAKQETLDPIKGLGRLLGRGVVGGLLMAMGLALMGLGALRYLQEQTGSKLSGNLVWARYGLAALGGVVLLGVLVTWWMKSLKKVVR